MALLNRLNARWSEPVDSASLRAIQAGFGLVIVVEALRYLIFGWVHRYYVEPPFHFTTVGFGWLHPLSEMGMIGLFVGVGLCGVALAWGFASRIAAGLFTVCFGAVFLMDQAYYQNHLYLVLIFGLFFTVADVHSRRSARRWMLDLGRFQVGAVYLFGGLAKLNHDWLQGEPMSSWMAIRADWPLIGPLLGLPTTGLVMAWVGMLLDLVIVPLLMWPRTRRLAFAAVVIFHGFNAVLFKIGVFPVLMLILTTVFFSADWCARREHRPQGEPTHFGRWVVPVVLIWMVLQASIPTRSWFYDGHTSWTEEGHRFSWRMKLRSKVGRVVFHALDKEKGTHKVIDPVAEIGRYHTRKMATRPRLILQYAHHLKARLASEGSGQWAVHVDARAALNGRPAQTLIVPTVDLASQDICAKPTWIVPLQD